MKDHNSPKAEPAQAQLTVLETISVRVPVACAMTGFNRSRVYELIASGELEIAKDGVSTFILVSSLRAAIERRRVVK